MILKHVILPFQSLRQMPILFTFTPVNVMSPEAYGNPHIYMTTLSC